MKEQIEDKVIEEMALDLCDKKTKVAIVIVSIDDEGKPRLARSSHYLKNLIEAGYRKQKEGEWEWFEEWLPSTTEHPRECEDCGWRCGNCKETLEDMAGGYWDDATKKPTLKFCPNCGAKMKGGAE